MFYYVSKIAWFFATPSNLLISLILLGLLLASSRAVCAASASALSLALHPGDDRPRPVCPSPAMSCCRWKSAFRPSATTAGRSTGSSCSAAPSRRRIRPPAACIVANEAAERVLDTIQLAHRYPEARILISGGGGTVFGDGAAEAPIVADYFKSIGIDPARILVEDRSRTTSENAVYSHELAKPREGERWLLVTSAWHMPRAVGVFEKAAFPGHALSGRFPHRRRSRIRTAPSPSSRKA